ncbi:MAG: ABC transporter substrate-binding protein, partial [Thermodesulfovibrionales bacterium]
MRNNQIKYVVLSNPIQKVLKFTIYSRKLKTLIFIAFLFPLIDALPSWAQGTVTLQLRWAETGHLAGFFIALKKGFYAEEGLDVRLKEANAHTNVVDEVVSGRAQYGIGTSGIIIDRQQGKPIVVLAVINQRSSNMLVTAYSSPIQSIDEIRGKDVMIAPYTEDILAYLKLHGLEAQYNRLNHSMDLQDLIKGKVYAMTISCPQPLEELEQMGFRYHVYNPRTDGIDFYGDNLFTSETEINNNPHRVSAFIKATLLGWQFVADSPKEAAEIIAKAYPEKGGADQILRQINAILPYIKSDIVPIGFMHEGRWRY